MRSISIDEQQRIVLYNEGAEKIFGYSRAEAIGAPLEMLIPERFRAIHREHVACYGAWSATTRTSASWTWRRRADTYGG